MKISFKKFLPGIAWFFIVLYIMCLPGRELPSVDNSYFDKIVHMGVFALLVLLFCWPFYSSSFNKKERLHYFIKIAIAASLWGFAIEIIQKYFAIGRYFDLVDWVADSIGALIALWFCSKKFVRYT